ncbi:MAG: hypothetical protein FJ146_12300 [Deltaproteobacteria bacterium]|nr:hypothetical protein [Deltaproteobacteria bacterium]
MVKPATRKILVTLDKLYFSGAVVALVTVAVASYDVTIHREKRQAQRYSNAVAASESQKNLSVPPAKDELAAVGVSSGRVATGTTAQANVATAVKTKGGQNSANNEKTPRPSESNPDDWETCLTGEGYLLTDEGLCLTIKDFAPPNMALAIGEFAAALIAAIAVLVVIRIWVKWLFKHFFE